MKTLTLKEYQAQMRAQGVPLKQVRFTCPRCGTEQCANDLIAAGVGEEAVMGYLGFSCVGRWDDKKGCDWTLGGLFQMHKVEVVTPDGTHHPRFEVAG